MLLYYFHFMNKNITITLCRDEPGRAGTDRNGLKKFAIVLCINNT